MDSKSKLKITFFKGCDTMVYDEREVVLVTRNVGRTL